MMEFIQNLAHQAPYTIVFGALLLAGLGVPLPEDIPLLVGGVLCGEAVAEGRQAPHISLMLIGAMACILLGDLFVFCMGRVWGPRMHEHPRILRLIGAENLERAKRLCQAKGAWFVVMARFLPGFRTPAFFAAGALKMRLRWFLLADGLAALVSAPLIMLAAYYFHDNIMAVIKWVKAGEKAGIGIVIAILAGLIIWKIIIKRRVAKMDVPVDNPPPGAGS